MGLPSLSLLGQCHLVNLFHTSKGTLFILQSAFYNILELERLEGIDNLFTGEFLIWVDIREDRTSIDTRLLFKGKHL